MHEDRPAFGQRLAELAELGVIEFRPEPLDTIVERRLKTIWEERSCPHCGADSLLALSGFDRIWCGRCDWKTTYTRGSPFYDSELTPSEFLIAFILYADTLQEEAEMGRKKRGRKPTPPEEVELPEDKKANATDPESQTLKTHDGWVQGYNGQAMVDCANQIIVAQDIMTQTTFSNSNRCWKPAKKSTASARGRRLPMLATGA